MRSSTLASDAAAFAAGQTIVVAATDLRFATFNASLNRDAAGQLVSDLSSPGSSANRVKQIRTVSEIIQRVQPDVLLVNEFDYVSNGQAADLFRNNFLSTGQNTINGTPAASSINYGYQFVAPSNTGIATGFDLNNNGSIGGGDDAYGFGNYEGQYGMAFFSKYPILTDQVRTFQTFKWKDMPGSTLNTDSALQSFYSADERNILRLSSKSHWDVPINVDGHVVHVLVSHPTPPTFDGSEDRNGKRNHDEIRFWADYVTGGTGASYIYDDEGSFGGLAQGEAFVIMGDQNADPFDGDSFGDAIEQLLNHPDIDTSITPSSIGGPQQTANTSGANANHGGNPAYDTADFNDSSPGNLRADYVLPSADGLTPLGGGVFWPGNTDPLFPLVGTFGNPSYYSNWASSDHRLVYMDVTVPEPTVPSAFLLGTLGLARSRHRFCN